MSKRILDETTKSTFASDDYLYMDSATDGATKITPDNLVRNTTVAQQLAQHIADAANDLADVQGDISDLQGDLADVKSDLGDLEDLETTDKSSLVAAINEATSSGGITSAAKNLIITIFRNALFSSDQSDNIDLLESQFANPATGVSINPSTLSFATLNATQQLVATVSPSDSSDTVSWSSSNTSVATVSENGLVTSVAYGSCVITATAGAVSSTCSVSVVQANLVSLTATYNQTSIIQTTNTLDDLKTDLTVTATWSNSTTSTVASTDYTLSGTLAVGTSVITVSYGGLSTTFNVTVSPKQYTTLYKMANTPVTANADVYENTGLEFGSSSANGYTSDWTMCVDLSNVTNEKYAFGCNGTGTIQALKFRTNGAGNPSFQYCNSYTSTPFVVNANHDFKFVVTHEKETVEYVTAYYLDSNGDVASTNFIKGGSGITSSSLAGTLYVGGNESAAHFVGTYNDFAVYTEIMDASDIEAYLKGV